MSDDPSRRPEAGQEEADAERQADNTIGFRNVDEEAAHDEAPGPQESEEAPPPRRPGH
jgi:hypothetical protein